MTDSPGCSVAVIGGGPAGLMAAEVLAAGGASVTVYERMPSLGRKLLLAGRGGLNLTHSEHLERFLPRYGAAEQRLRPALEVLPPEAVRAWCEALGQPTFVGSSGRVFPVAMKASPLLRAWLARLAAAGVEFRTRHRWLGWDDDGRLMFAAPDKERGRRRRRNRLGAWRRELAAARAPPAIGCRCSPSGASPLHRCGRPTAASSSLGRRHSAPLRRPAAEAHRAVVRRNDRARRSDDHARRHRRRGGLCAVGAPCATRSTRGGAASLHHRPAPRHVPRPTSPRASPSRAASNRCRPSCARPRALSPVADRAAAGGRARTSRRASA